jgi:PAS domain-containing protein
VEQALSAFACQPSILHGVLSAVRNQTGEPYILRSIIQYVNPAFTVLTGYSASEAIGQNPRLIRSGRHTAEFYRDLWSAISSGRTWEGDGSRHTAFSASSGLHSDRGIEFPTLRTNCSAFLRVFLRVLGASGVSLSSSIR